MRVYRKIVATEDRHIGDKPYYSIIPHHVLECGHSVPVRIPSSRGEAIAAAFITKRSCYKCAAERRKAQSEGSVPK